MQKTTSQKNITLTSFVEQINSYTRGFKRLTVPNAEEIIKFIQETTYPNYIGMIHEHLSCLNSEDSEKTLAFRVILSTKRNKANFSTQLVRECNGAIIIIEQLDVVRCRLITRPAHDCNPKIGSIPLINNNIRNGLYEIYRIDDGTTVNISYLERNGEGSWIFSTKNSYDAWNQEWRGRLNGEIITEVMNNYPGFTLDKLNPLKTYSIGFRHPAFHPFGGSDEMSAWFIQSTENASGVISTTDSIGLPTQERARVAAQGSKYWEAMQAKAAAALDEYVVSVQKGQPIRPFFGFILRSKDRERTKHFSDILIESSLMNEIRNSIYQTPFIPNKVVLAEYKQNFKNNRFVQIESYLDTKKRSLYELLFPTWVPLYHKYDAIVQEGVEQIYELLKTDPHGTNWVSNEIPTIIDKFVVALAPIAGSQVTADTDDGKKLITSLIIRSKYVDKFMQIFGSVEV